MSVAEQLPVARVSEIQLSLLPSEVIRRVSAVCITESEVMDRLRQMPNANGMLDLAMGPSHRGLGCSTCANDHLECQGHIGHIELPLPCFGAAQIRQLYSIVKVICPFCCRLTLPPHQREQHRQKTERLLTGLVAQSTFALATKQAKSKKLCPHADCQMPQPKYSHECGVFSWAWDQPADVALLKRVGWGEVLERPFSAREALSIFRHVPDEDWRLLGFSPETSHPAWMIYTCVPILPNCLRPVDRARNQQNDITLLGEAVVRQVNLLRRQIGEAIPAWVPRSVLALNEWLDEATELMIRCEIDARAPGRNLAHDEEQPANFATLRFPEEEDEQRPVRRPAVRRAQRVSFLKQAIDAAQAAMHSAQAKGRISTRQAGGIALKAPPGARWCAEDLPGSMWAGWTSRTFAELVKAGPRADNLPDYIRLAPFVMWAACYVVPEFMQVAHKPEVVESINTPNDEVAGWIAQQFRPVVNEIQHAVLRMISNDGRVTPKQVIQSGRFLSSLMSHHQGKEGWFRMFMCGKRVDFSARSVVTPGAQLDAHELGVPASIAKVLTMPEAVLSFSKRRLQEAIVNGYNHPMGASQVSDPSGRVYYLEFMPAHADRVALAERIDRGWTVERSLRDGDFTLFNRQPSLHRMSIQGHRVKVLVDNAEGIRSSRKASHAYALSMVTAGYFNADCDGDEMNQHQPQTAMSQMEVRHLFNVESIYLTPQAHRAGIGLVQNGLLLSYLISCKDVFFTRRQKELLESECRYGLRVADMPAAVESPRGALWTGKQILSQTFSPGLDVRKTTDAPASRLKVPFVALPERWRDVEALMHPAEHCVVILDGEFLAGRMCAKTAGKTALSIVDVLVRDVSRRAATKFLSDAQRLLEGYQRLRGFSLGVDDCYLTPRAQESVRRILALLDALPPAEPLSHEYEMSDEYAAREYELRSATSKIIDLANSIMLDDLMQTPRAKENSLLAMIASGAKGKIMNLQSVLTCIGQIVVQGVRVHRSLRQGKPFYLMPNDTSTRSSGCLRATYTQGVSAEEIIGAFFAGRESVVDTGINTSRTGYAYRRIVKGIENQRVALDGSVRDGAYLVQMRYGGAGASPEWFEHATVRTLDQSREALEALCAEMFTVTPAAGGDEYSPEELALVPAMAAAWRRAAVVVKEFSLTPFVHDSNTPAKQGEMKVIVPVNFERLIARYELRAHVDMERFITSYDWAERDALNEILADPAGQFPRVWRVLLKLDYDLRVQGGAGASAPTRLHMWESVHAFVQRAFQGVDEAHFDEALALVARTIVFVYADARTRWIRSRIEPGEQCGILAAQSIGEPTTQLTLNTAHNVGRGSENLQLGVPRLTEILDMTVKMKTPSMVIFPRRGADTGAIRHKFKGSTLTQLLLQVEVLRDPPSFDKSTSVPEDRAWMDLNRAYFGPDFDDEDVQDQDGKFVVATPRDYVVRYTLCADKLEHSRVSIVEVASRIRDVWHARPENTWESIFVTFTPAPIGRRYIVRVRCAGIRFTSITKPTRVQRASAQYQMSFFLRKLALMSQRLIEFGLSTSLASVSEPRAASVSDVTHNVAVAKEEVMTTRGTCLAHLQAVDDINWHKCVTNDILETFEVLGIGATRVLINQELTKIMSCDGSYVAFPHIWAVTDCVVFRGFPMRFSRHGQNRVDISLLQRASFEESAEQLVNASIFCEREPMQGITPNLILGQVVPAGTGSLGVAPGRVSVAPGVEALARGEAIDLGCMTDGEVRRVNNASTGSVADVFAARRLKYAPTGDTQGERVGAMIARLAGQQGRSALLGQWRQALEAKGGVASSLLLGGREAPAESDEPDARRKRVRFE